LVPGVAWGAAPSVEPLGLNPKELASVEAAAAGWHRGDPAVVIERLAPLVARGDADRLEAIERCLAANAAPHAGQLLAGARQSLALHGEPSRTKLSAREAVLVLPELERQLQIVWQAVDASRVRADPLPDADSMAEFERLLWDAHVLENRLASAQELAAAMARFARAVPRSQLDKLPEAERAIVACDYSAARAKLQAAADDVEQREIELRIRRLGLAESLLGATELTPEKLLAACAWHVDAALIAEFLARPRPRETPYARPELGDPQLAASIEAQADRCREKAGDLTAKAQLLVDGLHWWLRGRYGAGPEVGGLLKTAAALDSAEARFSLFMPAAPPRPVEPGLRGEAPVPHYDRRHHYWWTWGEQQVVRGGFETLHTEIHRTETSWTVETQFY
jgi:hypothetical protein